MGTYKALKGRKVKSLSSDPTANAASSGQMWYNTTSGALKYTGSGTGAWSTGGDMATRRKDAQGAGTSATNQLVCGGTNVWPSGGLESTEIYNGTSWAEANNINGGRFQGGGFGSVSSAIIVGGAKPYPTVTTNCEQYNGTSWVEVNDANNANLLGFATGTTSSGIVPINDDCEYWNGTCWSDVNTLSEGRDNITMCGSGTAALAIDGAPATTNVEDWNGTCWTEIIDNTTGRYHGSAGGTPASAVLCSGTAVTGYPFNFVEWFNGSAWSEVADTTQIRQACTGSGTSASMITVGGYTAPPADTYLKSCEEWSQPVYAVKTVTVS